MPITAMDLVAAAKKNITEIDADTVHITISNHLILDVREAAEYAAGCLPGAINISRGVLEFKIGSHPDFQDQHDADITVYCLTGGRSALAAEALNKLGYKKVVSLAGGFNAWKENGLPINQP